MMATTKPNQKIHIDKLKAASGELERLAEKPKEELSLRDSIYFLRDKLRLALKKGYNYQDLSELLEQQEILISAATLKQYLTEIDKEKRSGKRAAKSGAAKQPDDLTTSPEPVVDTSEHSFSESSEKPKADLSQAEREVTGQSDNLDIESSEKLSADLEENEREVSGQLDSDSGSGSQQKTDKTVKRKPRGISKSSRDLSSKFNQY